MPKCGKNVYAKPYKSVGDCTQFLYTPAPPYSQTASFPSKPWFIHETFQFLLTHFSTHSTHSLNRGESRVYTSYSHNLLLRLLTI